MMHCPKGFLWDWIKASLEDQNLLFDGNEIVSIEPNWTIEKGKWYMCIQNLCPPYISNQYNFMKGKVYCAYSDFEIKDDDGNLAVFLFDFPIADYFRPATEEEIAEAEYARQDQGIEKGLRESYKAIDEELHSHSESNELTDFEKCFQGMCHDKNQKFVKECCASLMTLARKQIVSKIDFEKMQNDYIVLLESRNMEHDKAVIASVSYRKGIEATIKAIEKGDEV